MLHAHEGDAVTVGRNRLDVEQTDAYSVPSRQFGSSERENAIDTITSKHRAYLRSLAHPLKPILHIGKEGVTEAAVHAVQDAFNTRELLKLKVLESAPDNARETAESLAGHIEAAHVVQVIGRTVVLYRPHTEKPGSLLPR